MSRRETETDTRAERPQGRDEGGRRQRVPLGTARLKLEAEKRHGHVRRWINDYRNRLHQAQEAGYAFVEETDAEGRNMRRSVQVGTREDGQPMLAYLMEIRQEFYDEDQAAKQKSVDAIDNAIRRGTPQGADAQKESHAFYVPAEGISMRREP